MELGFLTTGNELYRKRHVCCQNLRKQFATWDFWIWYSKKVFAFNFLYGHFWEKKIMPTIAQFHVVIHNFARSTSDGSRQSYSRNTVFLDKNNGSNLDRSHYKKYTIWKSVQNWPWRYSQIFVRRCLKADYGRDKICLKYDILKKF